MTSSDKHVERFRAHANYLRAFATLCTSPYQTGVLRPVNSLRDGLEVLAPVVASLPRLATSATAKPDLKQARVSLVNAWGTELLLALGGRLAGEEELLRLMNNWAAVQAYYVGYHAVQALLAARGYPRPDSHPKTQAQFASNWVDRSVNLPPWTFGARDRGWCNPPSRGIDDKISPWSTCDPDSCWSLAGKALRTTREDVVRRRLVEARERKRSSNRRSWLEEEQQRREGGKRSRKEPSWSLPRLSAAEKRRTYSNVRSYTVLDYLYRLRIKTNYEDAGMFIDGPEDEVTSRRVHNDIVMIAGCTLLVHELHIGEIVGRAQFLRWVNEWLGPNMHGQRLGLALRHDLIANHI